MKSLIIGLVAFCVTVTAGLFGVELTNASSKKIEWMTDYQAALAKSKETSKPIVLFFTGSDWCMWCHKLENEALNTPEFIQNASSKYIFVKVDFPMHSKLNANVDAQNKMLQKKFDIQAFPTVLVIDSKESLLGTASYRSGGGKKFAGDLDAVANQHAKTR